MKVLIIEDEKSIIDAINLAFEFRWPGVSLVPATTGKKGIELVKAESPDIVILDLNLPDMSGFDVLKSVREFSSVPVIILTVRSEDEDVLKGLELGADDYVIKPFNYMTLLARVKAVLRRSESVPFEGRHFNDVNERLKIDFVNQKVKVDNQPIGLTSTEYRLLALLIKTRGKVVPYHKILEEVWGKDYSGETDNLRIYIRRLRKKLHDIPPAMVVNERGRGYTFKGVTSSQTQ